MGEEVNGDDGAARFLGGGSGAVEGPEGRAIGFHQLRAAVRRYGVQPARGPERSPGRERPAAESDGGGA